MADEAEVPNKIDCVRIVVWSIDGKLALGAVVIDADSEECALFLSMEITDSLNKYAQDMPQNITVTAHKRNK